MIVLSLERLGAVNRQPSLSDAISWLNQVLASGVEVYQASEEVRIQTRRFPEGHVYPAGTIFVAEDAEPAPASVILDQMDENTEFVSSCRRLLAPGRIGVYNGLNGAPFCFDPYRNLLADYGFNYVVLSDEDIRTGALRSCDIVVVPGGPNAGESYYAGLGDKGFEELREFVAKGGRYLGSCAGAYLPLQAPTGSIQERMWLGLVPASDPAALDYWRTGAGFVRVALNTDSHSPVLNGLAYGEPSTVDVIYFEGPVFHALGSSVKVLATYQSFVGSGAEPQRWEVKDNSCAKDAMDWTNPLTRERFDTHLKGTPAAIEANYAQGRLILFSFHPEFGNPTLPWTSNPVHLLIINALFNLSSS